MASPEFPLPPGPDGFRNAPSNLLRSSHNLIDEILSEARDANDPHHCQIKKLETFTLISFEDSGAQIELIDAVLTRIWRIEGLGPRALDEGGVRGWNSIGWLTNLLRELLDGRTEPTGNQAISDLLVHLNEQGDAVYLSLGSQLPELAEWIERTTQSALLDETSQRTLNELATRFEGPASPRSIWKGRELRRTAESLRAAWKREIDRKHDSPVHAGSNDPTETKDLRSLGAAEIAGDERTADPIGSPQHSNTLHTHFWVDRRFHGRRTLQHPLAEQLRASGWTFGLQGAWDPPPHPSTIAGTMAAQITLELGERDPSDLLPGGSCRWVTLGEVRVAWASPGDEKNDAPSTPILPDEERDAPGAVTLPDEIVDLLRAAISLVANSVSDPI